MDGENSDEAGEDDEYEANFRRDLAKLNKENNEFVSKGRIPESYFNEAYSKWSYCVSWRGYWTRTVKELDDEFKSIQMEWRNSGEYKVLLAQMGELTKATKAPITNIIALGTGSLHDSWGQDKKMGQDGMRRRTGIQLAAVLALREILGGKSQARMHDSGEGLYANCQPS
jgi:hypothetical protein